MLPAVKKTPFLVQLKQIFGPPYFVTALTTMTKSRSACYRSHLKASKRFGLRLNTLLQICTDFNVLYSTIDDLYLSSKN